MLQHWLQNIYFWNGIVFSFFSSFFCFVLASDIMLPIRETAPKTKERKEEEEEEEKTPDSW